jgi:hypothetical protein
MKSNKLGAALEAHVPAPVVRPKKIRNPNLNPSRRGKVGLTLHLDEDAHQALKDIAYEHDKKIDALLREGANLMLQSYGRKPIA